VSAMVPSERRPTAAGFDRRGDEFEHWFARRFNFGAKARIRLYERLERFTTRKKPIREALESIWARYHRKKDARRAVFRRLVEQMAGAGSSFSSAIAPYIPPAERLMLFAGEEGAKLPVGLQKARFVAEAVQKMRKALISELRYPVLLVVFLAVMLVVIAYQLVPIMLQMAPLSKWPPVSMMLYYIATAVKVAGIWFVAFVFAAAVLIARTIDTWTGPMRRFADKYLPPWTIYRVYQGSTFLISIAALIEAGRPIDVALKQITPISKPWLREHVVAMLQQLSAGVPPGRAIDTGLLDDEVCGDIEDYGSAGAFDQAIGAVGQDTISDSIERIALQAGVVRGVLMLMVAAGILLVYGGMFFLVLETARGMNVPK